MCVDLSSIILAHVSCPFSVGHMQLGKLVPPQPQAYMYIYGSLSSYYTLEYLYIHTEIRTDQLLVP